MVNLPFLCEIYTEILPTSPHCINLYGKFTFPVWNLHLNSPPFPKGSHFVWQSYLSYLEYLWENLYGWKTFLVWQLLLIHMCKIGCRFSLAGTVSIAVWFQIKFQKSMIWSPLIYISLNPWIVGANTRRRIEKSWPWFLRNPPETTFHQTSPSHRYHERNFSP